MPKLTRRSFVASSVAAGFALAVQPVTADTITTDSGGLTAGMVEIPAGADKLPAYRARPDKGGPFPVVLVVQEIFGVHEHIQDVCRRLAKLGYLAVATELFHRQGDVSKVADRKEIQKIVGQVPDAQVMGDLDATVAWAGQDGGDPGRVAITGFCWGGRITWLYAAHRKGLRAGVAWYGRLTNDREERHPKHPVDVAKDLQAPVLGLYGAEDTGIPLPTIEAMRAAAKDAKVKTEIVVYPKTPHAFHADYRPSYRPEAAADGWKRMLAWFGANGVK